LILSVRPGEDNVEKSLGISPTGGPTRVTNGQERPSREDRMLKEVDNIIKNIYL
jgi:hypothetical protein